MDGYSYGIRDVGGETVHLSRAKAYGRGFETGDVVGCLITLPQRNEDPGKIKRARLPLQYKGQSYFEMEEYAVQKEMEALVDREGKVAAAAKASAAAARDAVVEEQPKISKKGAITKNAKKGKKEAETPTGPVARQLPILPGSRIEFFVNGESFGTAFEDLYDFVPLPPVVVPTAPAAKRAHDLSKDLSHDDGTLGYYPMVSCFGRGKVQVNFGPEWQKPPPGLTARPLADRWEEFRAEERVLDERDEAEAMEKMLLDMKAEEERKKVILERQAKGENGLVKKEPAKKKRKGTEISRPDTPLAGATPVRDLASSQKSSPAPTPTVELKSEAPIPAAEPNLEKDERLPVYPSVPEAATPVYKVELNDEDDEAEDGKMEVDDFLTGQLLYNHAGA